MSRQHKHKKKYKFKKKTKGRETKSVKERNKRIRNEVAGIFLLALGLLIFLSYYIDDSIGVFGNTIRNLLTGIAGVPSFLIPIIIIMYSVFIIFRKNKKQVKLKALYSLILLIILSAFFQVGIYKSIDYQNRNPLDCITLFYKEGQNMLGGGVLGGIVALPLLLVFQTLGTIIILISLSIVDIILLTEISIYKIFKGIKESFVKGTKKLIEGVIEVKKEYKDKGKDIDIDIDIDIGIDKDKDEDRDKDRDRDRTDTSYLDDNLEISVNLGGVKANIEDEVLLQTENLEQSLGEDMEQDKIVSLNKKRLSTSKIIGTKTASKGYRNEEDDSGTAQNKETIEGKMREFLYKYPPINLLNGNKDSGRSSRTYKNIAIEGAKKLEETLKSFNVEAKVVNVTVGPTVTRFELQPHAGVKVSRIVSLADDIALNLASHGVRIEAPIPGKAAIGIEVPNKTITPVFLREVIESKEFSQHPSKVSFAIGKDISGKCIVTDITKMPHLLISGATGSGKSVCINSLIMSILYKASPDEVKMLLIDPKVVELGVYNGIPHLLIPVVTDPKKAAGALNWAVQEMVERYKLFAEKGVREIKGYNAYISQNGEEDPLPLIVIIIDELSDLMMVAPGEVEEAICRLAQMARAAGMHLIVSTQRPSVDVITGLIKANIPSRISFAVSSQVDSRTILDMGGAEKLLGRGDLLFYPTGQQKPSRVQGTYVSDKEVERVVEFIKSRSNIEYDSDIIDEIDKSTSETGGSMEDEYDELLPEVIEMVIEMGQASVSLVQRRFRVGYARAARIIDQMEMRGIVGGFEGSKPRQVLITRQQWHELNMSQ